MITMLTAREIARCDREIAEAERNLREGYLKFEGVLQQLMDWSIERRMLIQQRRAKRKGVTHGT